jgi:ribonuclease BN (tRNA processing enzyme)
VQVTVLGKSPSWQDAAGACSGYLVQEGPLSLLLDCGNGIFSKLRVMRDYHDLDAVLISHMHADHFLDLVPFSYAISYGPRPPLAPPQLFVPAGGVDVLRRVVGCWGSERLVENAFSVSEYTAADELGFGGVGVRFCEVPHFTKTYAVELTSTAGRFTFGADCRPNDELVRFAHDTDLLMVEATLVEPEPDGPRGHMTAREAGEQGRLAGARRLVLTHYSDELDPDRTRAQGSDGYGAPVELATEGAVYRI